MVVKRGSGRSVTNFGVVELRPGMANIVPARAGADAVVLLATDLPTFGVIERLEAETGVIQRKRPRTGV